MRGTSVTPLADGLALLSLDGGPDGDAGGDLHWELSCSRLPAGAAGVARPRFSPAMRAASGAGASTSTWGEGEVAGAPSSRRPGDMRGGALFQVRQTAGEAKRAKERLQRQFAGRARQPAVCAAVAEWPRPRCHGASPL
jgi:hypothetical protein